MDSGTRTRKRKVDNKKLQGKYHGHSVLERAKEPTRLANITPPAPVSTVNLERLNGPSPPLPDTERSIYAIRQPREGHEQDHVTDIIPQCNLVRANSSCQPDSGVSLKTLTSSVAFKMSFVPYVITRLVNLYNKAGYPYLNMARALENSVEINRQAGHIAPQELAYNYGDPQRTRNLHSGSQQFQSCDLALINSPDDSCSACTTSFKHQKRTQKEQPVHFGQLHCQASRTMYCSVQKPPSQPTLPRGRFVHYKPTPRCCNQFSPPPCPQCNEEQANNYEPHNILR